jgi:hypothetical protein
MAQYEKRKIFSVLGTHVQTWLIFVYNGVRKTKNFFVGGICATQFICMYISLGHIKKHCAFIFA